MKKYKDFIAEYRDGDEQKLYKNKSLLFYAASNTDIDSRFLITDFLITKGADVRVTNECNENLLHILLSRTTHNLEQTRILCQKIIEAGVDINQMDEKGRVPLQYLINMKYTDEELEPLYDLWFSQSNLDFRHKNAWDKTPLELAEMLPYREKLVERMHNYE
ncbi:ankyrin repeat domain-containing protein [Pseudobutyrivibrio xylanivorans]|nr:ankyrin repeat domain-containing protein [Pseudobutyrivibrio xylanivorans]